MKKINKINFLPLVILLAGIALVAGPVLGKDTILEKFNNAEVVQDGKDYTGEALTDSNKYYQTEVTPGHQLQVYGTAEQADSEAKFVLSLYLGDGELLSTSRVRAYTDPNQAETAAVFYLPGVAEEVFTMNDYETVYVEAKAEGKINNYSFSVKLANKDDLGEKTDAGNTAKESLLVDVGEYPKNHLAWNLCGENQYCSTDSADVYYANVYKDETITFNIQAAGDLDIKASLLDENEDEIISTDDKKGKIQIEYTSKAEEIVYLVIEGEGEVIFGTYSLSVESDDKNRSKASTGSNSNSTNINTSNSNKAVDANDNSANVNTENSNGVSLAPVVQSGERDLNAFVSQEISVEEEQNFVDQLLAQLKDSVIIIIIIGGLFLVVLIILVVVLIKRKKRVNRMPFSAPTSPSAPAPDNNNFKKQ